MAIPADGNDFQSYTGLFSKIMGMIKKRYAVLNSCDHWPPPSHVHETGKVGAVVDNGNGTWTFTDDTPLDFTNGVAKDWSDPTGSSGPGTHRFVNRNTPLSCYLNGDYDVIISAGDKTFPYGNDYWNEQIQIRGQISSHTTSAPLKCTFTAKDFVNAGVAGYWTGNPSDLTGCRYYFVQRGSVDALKSKGVWWSDQNDSLSRWIPFPNDQELWHGTITSYNNSTFILTQATDVYTGGGVSWEQNKWTGKQVLCYDTSGYLRRLTIASSDSNTITFTSGAYTLSGFFIIINAGAKGYPIQSRKHYPFAYYSGAVVGAYTNTPNDTLGSVYVPTDNVIWQEPDESNNCADKDHNAIDIDLISDWQEECGCPSASDAFYSPKFWRTIRSWQTWVYQWCGGFFNEHMFDKMINYTFPMLMNYLGINSGTASASETGGNFYFGGMSAYEGKTIYWSLFDSSGKRTDPLSGVGTVSGGQVQMGSGPWDASDAAADPTNRSSEVGKTVYWTLGFTREYPLTVRYPWKHTGFIPSAATGTGLCDGVGSFETRLNSTNYAQAGSVTSTMGMVGDSGPAPQLGDVARIVGDNANDPTVHPYPSLVAGAMTISDGTVEYWRNFYQGNHPDSTTKTLREQLTGTVTSVSPNSLTDSTKDWYTGWNTYTLYRSETGSATTTGTTLSLTDSSKNILTEAGCHFNNGRNGYVGFIIKFTSGANNGLKRVITAFNSSTRTITWSTALPNAVSSGDTYSIDEPYTLNRYQGRVLRLYNSDGTHSDVWITNSDNDTLFWSSSEGVSATAGQRYKIIEPTFGGVYKYSSSRPTDDIDYYQVASNRFWIPCSGTDSRGADWHDNVFENLPYKAQKDYGWFNNGDYVTTTLLSELYRAISELTKTLRKDITWSCCKDPLVGEVNWHEANYTTSPEECGNISSVGADGIWNCTKAITEGLWDHTIVKEDSDSYGTINDLPQTYSAGYILASSSIGNGTIHRQYSYVSVTGVPVCVNSSITIWCLARKCFADAAVEPYYHNVFSNMGEGNFTENQWGSIASTEVEPDGNTRRVRVGYQGVPTGTGPVQKPQWCQQPATDGTTEIMGYEVTKGVAVISWSFGD
jgi:hypothetical protein